METVYYFIVGVLARLFNMPSPKEVETKAKEDRAESEAEVARLRNEVLNNGFGNETLKTMLKERDAEVARLTTKVGNGEFRERALEARIAEVEADRDAKLAAKDKEIADIEADRDAKLAAKDKEIADIKADRDEKLAAKDEYWKGMIVSREAQIKEVIAESIRGNKTLEKLNDTLDAQRKRIKKLEEQKKEWEAEREDLMARAKSGQIVRAW
jgi:septal ring factor EnvC (AmiA/AmiB activator)